MYFWSSAGFASAAFRGSGTKTPRGRGRCARLRYSLVFDLGEVRQITAGETLRVAPAGPWPRWNPSAPLLGTQANECKSRAKAGGLTGFLVWFARPHSREAGLSAAFALVDHLADSAPSLLLLKVAEEVGVH